MRSPILILLCILFTSSSFSQRTGPGFVSQGILDQEKAGALFRPVSLLQRVAPSPVTDELWSRACSKAVVSRYDRPAAQALIASHPQFISLSVPTANDVMRLDLERTEPTTDNFVVHRASDGAEVRPDASVHYRGIIHGVPNSLVSISVFAGEIMGIVSDGNGQQVLGKFEHAPQDLHVFYREHDLLATSGAVCGTVDPPTGRRTGKPEVAGSAKSIRCVHWYWEVANDIFLNKGSVTEATNYVTGLFAQSATIYANDGVNVALQEVFVWDVASPYNGTSSSSRLSQFGTTRTSFNGDMAHLLDNGGYGGVAWLTTLCSGTSARMAYSGIYNSFSNVPTYSWSVEVVTHEQGHNLGSRHTHACAWNGDNTAIDGCGPTAGYTEGSCPTGPLPSSAVGGTIMSYCHLVSSGINFVNGFGPQPKAVILNNVNAASCLLTCGTSCDPPALGITSLNSISCTLTWSNVGAVSYTLRWKAQSSGTWNVVTGITGTTYALTGLTQSTAYEFQVLTVCSSASSAYSASYNFTTPVPCPDANEPNNSLAAAANITLPTSISALIASNVDLDYYRFTIANAGTVNLYLSNVAGDYDLYLLNSTGTTVASSTFGGTSNESVSYSATAGTYVIEVLGYNGAFSAYQCYQLSANFTQSCGPVTGLTATGITYNSATISWTAFSGSLSYDLDWKITAGSTWTTVTALSGTSYGLTGLAWSTSYDYRIKPNCQVTGQSQYGSIQSFTTSNPPCDVSPPIVLAAKVFLEGPYKSANLMLTDSLRKQGVLPLTEPYTTLGLVVTGANTTTNAVLAVTGNNAIVDWVLVELRDPATLTTVVERRAALLQRDGDVVALDGVSPLGFCSAAGSYRVAVRHRNHLGCMTGAPFNLGPSATPIDFTSSALGTYGTLARNTIGSVQVLWAGNTTGDTNVMYTGAGNDRDPILTAVGSTTPNNTVSGYLRTDVNMDGRAQYTGSANDRDPVLINVGSTTPNNVKVEQLP